MLSCSIVHTGRSWGLAVFSEGIVAFCTAQELCRGLVSSASLYLPDISSVIIATRTFKSHCWECAKFLFLFTDNGYKLLGVVLNNF